MTIPIADRAAKTAIALQAMPLQEHAVTMGLANSQIAKQIITFTIMPVKRTLPQTAVSMTNGVMSQMPRIHVPMETVLLHATRNFTRIIIPVR